MSSQLRLFDPQIKEKPDQESLIEPLWLVRLRHVDGQIKVQNVLLTMKSSLLRISVKPTVFIGLFYTANYRADEATCGSLMA